MGFFGLLDSPELSSDDKTVHLPPPLTPPSTRHYETSFIIVSGTTSTLSPPKDICLPFSSGCVYPRIVDEHFLQLTTTRVEDRFSRQTKPRGRLGTPISLPCMTCQTPCPTDVVSRGTGVFHLSCTVAIELIQPRIPTERGRSHMLGSKDLHLKGDPQIRHVDGIS